MVHLTQVLFMVFFPFSLKCLVVLCIYNIFKLKISSVFVLGVN